MATRYRAALIGGGTLAALFALAWAVNELCEEAYLHGFEDGRSRP